MEIFKKNTRKSPFFLIFRFFFTVLLSQVPYPIESFASWFVQTSSSCYVDLRDTKEEIIMHNFIIPAKESKHGDDVSIEVFKKDDKLSILHPINFEVIDVNTDGKKEKKKVFYLDYDDVQSDKNEGKECLVTYDDNADDKSVKFEYILKLNVNEDAKLYDLQYVMDVKLLPEEENDTVMDDSLNDQSERKGIKVGFTRRSGCKNMRAHGKKGDGGLTLKIQIPLSIYKNASSNLNDTRTDIGEQGIDVVAGWACGNEAVTLTRSIQFRPRLTTTKNCFSTNL